ncbi:hypothetical protein ACFZB2_35430 [Streptomyces bobili]|uniref:hypothetical protein n=1 Tax=Streptomyces bobili TaxID=67280 RepID=UPI0036E7EE31
MAPVVPYRWSTASTDSTEATSVGEWQASSARGAISRPIQELAVLPARGRRQLPACEADFVTDLSTSPL